MFTKKSCKASYSNLGIYPSLANHRSSEIKAKVEKSEWEFGTANSYGHRLCQFHRSSGDIPTVGENAQLAAKKRQQSLLARTTAII